MKRAFFAVLTVLIGAAVVAGSVVLLGNAQAEPAVLVAKVVGTAKTDKGEVPHATVALSIYPEPSASVPGPVRGPAIGAVSDGWPFYWPSTTLQLPANSLITMTVLQYDGSTTVWNDYFAKVHGTVDGTAVYNGKVQDRIEADNVAHTFTLHQYPESTQPELFVSVPMLAVASPRRSPSPS